MQALVPLLATNASLRDHTMLVLRKSMFSREVDARSVAVEGFVVLLESLKVGAQAYLLRMFRLFLSSQTLPENTSFSQRDKTAVSAEQMGIEVCFSGR